MLILEDGRGIRRSWGMQDLTFEASDAALGELLTVEAFDACLADLSFGCLRQPLASEDAICDEGWQHTEV